LLNNGNFASEVIKWYCEKEKQLFFKIKSLGHKQMHGRLADILLYLCSDEFKEKNIFNYLSRKDIADFACISTESVVRLLTELKNEKIIEMEGKDIEILQLDLLKEISRRG
jgi:CRP/FNR family transcriptional regulator